MNKISDSWSFKIVMLVARGIYVLIEMGKYSYINIENLLYPL